MRNHSGELLPPLPTYPNSLNSDHHYTTAEMSPAPSSTSLKRVASQPSNTSKRTKAADRILDDPDAVLENEKSPIYAEETNLKVRPSLMFNMNIHLHFHRLFSPTLLLKSPLARLASISLKYQAKSFRALLLSSRRTDALVDMIRTGLLRPTRLLLYARPAVSTSTRRRSLRRTGMKRNLSRKARRNRRVKVIRTQRRLMSMRMNWLKVSELALHIKTAGKSEYKRVK